MLVEISQKLDRIETKVDRIEHSLDDDRRQELEGAIDSANTALACAPEVGHSLLVAAATLLRIPIGKEIQALGRTIEQAPMPSRWHMVRAVRDISDQTQRELLAAKKTLMSVLQGIGALTRLYLVLSQDRAAWSTMYTLLTQLSEAGLDNAWWKARRLVPNKPEEAPEVFWTHAMAHLADARTCAFAYSKGILPDLTLPLSKLDIELIVL